MASVLVHFDTDFDTWKRAFDADPAGRAGSAKGYTISRGVENPNDVFVRLEFESVAEAEGFRDRLLGAGVLGAFDVKTPPTVVEVVETHTY
jgi:hypothetical protein